MLKVDAYNHIYPRKYWDAMIDKAGAHEDLGKRTRSVPMLIPGVARKKSSGAVVDFQP